MRGGYKRKKNQKKKEKKVSSQMGLVKQQLTTDHNMRNLHFLCVSWGKGGTKFININK